MTLPTVRFSLKECAWIRCEDEMPPQNRDVLAYQESTMRMGIGHWMQRDDGKMWSFRGSTMHEALFANTNLSRTDFSHWMALPEAPE